MSESQEQEFLVSLSTKEKVLVSNLSHNIYLAEIMQKQGYTTAAARVIDSYLQQNPWLTDSLKLLTRLSNAELERLGMSVKAAQDGIKAHSTGNSEEAQRYFEEACRHNPYNADAWCSLGIIIAQAGDHAKGVATIKKSLSLDPDNQAACQSLAAISGYQK